MEQLPPNTTTRSIRSSHYIDDENEVMILMLDELLTLDKESNY